MKLRYKTVLFLVRFDQIRHFRKSLPKLNHTTQLSCIHVQFQKSSHSNIEIFTHNIFKNFYYELQSQLHEHLSHI